MTLGDRIKNRRESLNMSQVDLANKIGVKKQTLYKYENNIITNIPSDKIENICKVLETSPAYIMGWEKNLSEDNIDMIPDLLSNTALMDSVKKLAALNKEHQQTIFDNISYWYEKEGH